MPIGTFNKFNEGVCWLRMITCFTVDDDAIIPDEAIFRNDTHLLANMAAALHPPKPEASFIP